MYICTYIYAHTHILPIQIYRTYVHAVPIVYKFIHHHPPHRQPQPQPPFAHPPSCDQQPPPAFSATFCSIPYT